MDDVQETQQPPHLTKDLRSVRPTDPTLMTEGNGGIKVSLTGPNTDSEVGLALGMAENR